MDAFDLSRFELHTDPSHVALAACIVAATYLQYRSMKPPKPLGTTASGQAPVQASGQVLDLIGILGTGPSVRWLNNGLAALGLARAVFVIVRPIKPSAICPAPELLSPEHFEWTPLTVATLACLLFGGVVRVTAYAQLGNNFSYKLAKPNRLVKEGLYHYIQHPSYLAMTIVAVGMVLGPSDPGAGAGCFAPVWFRPHLSWLYGGLIAMLTVLITLLVPLRIPREEEMLRKAFGKEWEEYHRSTSRLIPGVF